MDTRHGAALAASVLYTNLRSQTSLDVLLVFQLTVLQAGLALRFSHPFRLTTTEAKAIFEVAVKIETQLPSSGWDRILSVMVRLLGDAL
ncbi:MAG: hypothetical protein H7287_13990 [Thermoleophilia bacterium]|nr:hypothetical protein [Thermoleophilia bacterium]